MKWRHWVLPMILIGALFLVPVADAMTPPPGLERHFHTHLERPTSEGTLYNISAVGSGNPIVRDRENTSITPGTGALVTEGHAPDVQ